MAWRHVHDSDPVRTIVLLMENDGAGLPGKNFIRADSNSTRSIGRDVELLSFVRSGERSKGADAKSPRIHTTIGSMDFRGLAAKGAHPGMDGVGNKFATTGIGGGILDDAGRFQS